MLIKILPDGVGSKPIVMRASLIIAEFDTGEPVMIAGHYGPGDTIKASHYWDSDFAPVLSELGYESIPQCDKLVLPPAPVGARLISTPQ